MKPNKYHINPHKIHENPEIDSFWFTIYFPATISSKITNTAFEKILINGAIWQPANDEGGDQNQQNII